MVVSVTGHRPDKLFGYDIHDIRYFLMVQRMKNYLVNVKCTEAVTGMALGVDLLFAQAVLMLKDEGSKIKLHCAIPCQNHKAKWGNSDWTIKYDEVLQRADFVKTVCERPYDRFVMQIRNEYMVDLSDRVLAVYNGSSGGTKNCIDYAIKKGKKVDIIDPIRLAT